jgi:hypothetical protein
LLSWNSFSASAQVKVEAVGQSDDIGGYHPIQYMCDPLSPIRKVRSSCLYIRPGLSAWHFDLPKMSVLYPFAPPFFHGFDRDCPSSIAWAVVELVSKFRALAYCSMTLKLPLYLCEDIEVIELGWLFLLSIWVPLRRLRNILSSGIFVKYFGP